MNEIYGDLTRRFCDPSNIRAQVNAADVMQAERQLREKVERLREEIDRLKQENAKLKAQREVLMELARH
jgi:phage shock protein A